MVSMNGLYGGNKVQSCESRLAMEMDECKQSAKTVLKIALFLNGLSCNEWKSYLQEHIKSVAKNWRAES